MARLRIWGDEVYFSTPVKAKLEADAHQVVAAGTACFWTEGDSIALPLFNPCNVLGTVDDLKALRNIKAGDRIRVEKA